MTSPTGDIFFGDIFLGEHPEGLEGAGCEHIGSPLHAVVQWFKTMTIHENIRGVKTLGWQRFEVKLWQHNQERINS